MTKTVSARAPEDVLERAARAHYENMRRPHMIAAGMPAWDDLGDKSKPYEAMSAALAASGLVERVEALETFLSSILYEPDAYALGYLRTYGPALLSPKERG